MTDSASYPKLTAGYFCKPRKSRSVKGRPRNIEPIQTKVHAITRLGTALCGWEPKIGSELVNASKLEHVNCSHCRLRLRKFANATKKKESAEVISHKASIINSTDHLINGQHAPYTIWLIANVLFKKRYIARDALSRLLDEDRDQRGWRRRSSYYGVSTAIKKLRRLLEGSGYEIKTIYGEGYQLAGPSRADSNKSAGHDVVNFMDAHDWSRLPNYHLGDVQQKRVVNS